MVMGITIKRAIMIMIFKGLKIVSVVGMIPILASKKCPLVAKPDSWRDLDATSDSVVFKDFAGDFPVEIDARNPCPALQLAYVEGATKSLSRLVSSAGLLD